MKPGKSAVLRSVKNGLDISEVTQNGFKEYYISLGLEKGDIDAPLAALFSFLKETGAGIVLQLIFGEASAKQAVLEKMKKMNGRVNWPVMGLEHDNGKKFPLSGMQVFAVSGTALKELKQNGLVAGYAYGNADFDCAVMANVEPDDRALSLKEQTFCVYDRAVALLKEAGMDFSNVARTWFYLDKLLDWYKEFNEARTSFLTKNGIFLKLVPASTGIGARNFESTVLSTAFYAVKPKNKTVKISKIESPMQCEAFSYKSAFSRAVEIDTGAVRKLMISGTASILPDGKSAHAGDLDKQIELTLKVVSEILKSRGMDFSNVTRSVLYFKEKGAAPAFKKYCERSGIPAFPSVTAYTTVCREELLFEIELDAVKQ